MKKRSIFLIASCVMLACSVPVFAEEGGTEMTSESTVIEANQEVSSIQTEEIRIPNGEKEIFGVLYKPETDGKCPVVILSHGYNGSNADFVGECEYFASMGIAAFAYDFCGGSVNSKSSGESTDMTVFTEKEDLKAVLDYIRTLEIVDPEQIFLFGGSQGGLVTALTAEERAEDVKGLVLYFPAFNIPDDWRNTYPTVEEIPEILEFWGLNLGKEFFVSLHDFETFENIGTFHENVLIIHGDEDAIVPLSYAIKAQETYENAELVILPGEGHGFSEEGGVEARELAGRFIQKNCR